MIALRSSISDGSSFRVYDDDILIGHIHRQRGLTGDRYLASIDWNGEKKSNDKTFYCPDDALQWIEKQR